MSSASFRASKIAMFVVLLSIVFLCAEYRVIILGYIIENLLIEKRDITEGHIGRFYVGMKRSSVISELETAIPSSVEAEPSSTFYISDENSDEWEKLDKNGDIGIMLKFRGEIFVRFHDGIIKEIKCMGYIGDLCNLAHVSKTLSNLELNIKQQMVRGISLSVFPVLFNKPKFIPVADLEREGYLPLLGYNGWQIRYKIDNGDDIYDVFFDKDKISRIRYEHPLVQVGD
jgi:hypothetical protein